MTATRVETEFTGDARDLQRKLAQLDNRMDKFAANTAKASQKASASINAIGTSVDGIGPVLSRLGPMFAAAFSVTEVIAMADSFTQFQAKLINAGVAASDMASVQKRLFDIARANGQEIGGLAELYGSMSMATSDLGLSQEVLETTTESVSAALKLGGASAAQASAAILQFSQALASGKMAGEEFGALMDSAPALMRALAQAIPGVNGNMGALKKAMIDGKLTTEAMIAALGQMNGDLVTRAAAAPLTISQGFTNLRTEMVKYIGETDQTLGATEKIGQALTMLGDNIGTVVKSLAIVAAFLAGKYAASLVEAGIKAVRLATFNNSMAASMTGVSRGALLASTAMTTLSAAGSRALALFGGPLGIALTAIGLALGSLAGEAMAANGSAESMNQTLARSADVLDEVRQMSGHAASASSAVGSSAAAASTGVQTLGNRAQTAAAQLRDYAAAQREAALQKLAIERETVSREVAALEQRSPTGRRRDGLRTSYPDVSQAWGAFSRLVVGETSALLTGGRTDERIAASEAAGRRRLDEIDAESRRINSLGDDAFGRPPGSPPDTPPRTGGGGGGGPSAAELAERAAREAAQKAEEQARRTAEIADNDARLISAAKRRQLEFENSINDTIWGRLDYQLGIAELEHQEELAAIERQRAAGDITEAVAAQAVVAADQLKSMQIDAAYRENAAADFAETTDHIARRNQYEQEINGYTQEILRLAMEQADSRDERLAIEKQSFDLQQKAEKDNMLARQQETLNRLKIANALQSEIDQLVAFQAQERASFDALQAAQVASEEQRVRNENPFAAIVDQAKDMKAALQDIAVDGLKTLEDGLVDVIMRTGSLGDAFKAMSKQVVADLARIAIQKAIVGPLANFLGFGDGAGLFNFFTPKRNAIGTRHSPGGLTMVGEAGPELVNMPRGSQVLPNGDVRKLAVKQGSAGPRQNVYNFSTTVNADGAVMRDDIRNEIYQAHLLAVQEAKSQTMTDIGNSQRRRLR